MTTKTIKIQTVCIVETGSVCVADEKFYLDNGGIACTGPAARVIDVGKAGRYEVTVLVANTYLGNKRAKSILTTKNGKFVVGDPCSYFGSSSVSGSVWKSFLDKTEFLAKRSSRLLPVNTGGDASFVTTVTVKPVVKPSIKAKKK